MAFNREDQCATDISHSDNKALMIRRTSLRTRSTVLFDNGQYEGVNCCLMCNSIVKLFMSNILKSEPRSVKSQFIPPKHDVHLANMFVTASLSKLSQGQSQIYELVSSLTMNTYFKSLSSAGLLYRKSTCTTSFGFFLYRTR